MNIEQFDNTHWNSGMTVHYDGSFYKVVGVKFYPRSIIGSILGVITNIPCQDLEIDEPEIREGNHLSDALADIGLHFKFDDVLNKQEYSNILTDNDLTLELKAK